MANVWLGFIDASGKIQLQRTAEFKKYLATLIDQDVTVTVDRRSKKRSVQQNKWLWGCAIPLIAEHCGYDHHEHERLHYDLLAVRFGTVAVSPLVPGAPPRIVPTKTSSELTTKEFTEYMDWLVRYAAEKFSIVIPLPDEPDPEGA